MLTVVVLTKNEEDLIKVCLESVKWADEIIIVDEGSTDQTLGIAKKYTDKIFVEKNPDFSIRRNLGMEKAKGDWVLYVDSDERVLEPLRIEIEQIVHSSEKSAYNSSNARISSSAYAISRKNIIFGEKVDYGPYKKDWMIRLFKKDKFKGWVGEVHEHGTFDGELGYTKNSFLHLTHRDLDHFILKSLEWSKIDANLRLKANHPPMSDWRFIRIFITETFKQGIGRKGFFNGTVGVMDSMLQVFSLFITYVRLWQLQQPKSLDKTYKEIDKKLLENNFKR